MWSIMRSIAPLREKTALARANAARRFVDRVDDPQGQQSEANME